MCRLREMRVEGCDSLVHLFPTNPIPWLLHLEELLVKKCGSVEVIFELDLECIEGSSSLKRINLMEMGKLIEVWRIKGIVKKLDHILHSFQALKSLRIGNCESFRHVITPTSVNFDLGELEDINIYGCEHWGEGGRMNKEMVERSRTIPTQHEIVVWQGLEMRKESELELGGVAFLSHLIPTFHHLRRLYLCGCKQLEVVFEIESESTSSGNQQPLLLPHLKKLELRAMERMSWVWKCKWKKLLLEGIPQQQQAVYAFHNLTTIYLNQCNNIKYLLSPLMAKLLSNLNKLEIWWCDAMEEIVSNRDDDVDEMGTSTHTNTVEFFPHLDTINFDSLLSLKCIGGGGWCGDWNNTTMTSYLNQRAQVASWSLCQYSKKIYISRCRSLSSVIPSHAVGQLQKLEELKIKNCKSMMEVFETEQINNCSSSGEGIALTIPRLTDLYLEKLPKLRYMCKNQLLMKFLCLTKLEIKDCEVLEHIFTCSVVESLKQLKELKIERCKAMQVIIVKEEDDGEHTTTSKVLVFPRLQSLALDNLPNLKGFFLGMNEFQWPLLDHVKINDCTEMTVFTYGHSTTPKLNYIYTSLGKHSLECGLNFHLTTALHQTQFPSSERTEHELQLPWSFSNLIEVDVDNNHDLMYIIPSNELQQLQKLEKLNVKFCKSVMEVFEVAEGTNNDMSETQSAVIFPKLTEMNLLGLRSLEHIWKSHNWTVLEFPNLTRVSIEQCHLLGHLFSCSMVGSLLQLQELHISKCNKMEVIIKEEDDEAETGGRKKEVVMFPCLKSLKLEYLRNLKGFYLGKEALRWLSLDSLEIKQCRQITVFTSGQSVTPELKVIDTSFGLCYAREDTNSFIKTKIQEGFKF